MQREGTPQECWPGRLRMLWAGAHKDPEKVIARFYGYTDSVISNYYWKDKENMNRLREQRERSRLTVEEVSKVTGISAGTISKYENGQLKLSDEKAKILAKLYKVETHELFLTLESESAK